MSRCRSRRLRSFDSAVAPALAPSVAARMLAAIPPIRGAEYACDATIAHAWRATHRAAADAVAEHGDDFGAWLQHAAPAWQGVGRVFFHLAENKADPEHPFAFVATYVDGLAPSGEPLHRTLQHALARLDGDRAALLRMLRPLIRSETSASRTFGLDEGLHRPATPAFRTV